MDAADIYANLQDFNLGDRVQKLEDENKRLSELVQSLQEDVKKLCDSVVKMKQIQDNLGFNISGLYKTAKAEIDRKDRMISELRRELDNHIFRRKKHGHMANVVNEKNYSASCEQQQSIKNTAFNSDLCNERASARHDENEQLSVTSKQEQKEKISVNVKSDVNIKSHEKNYHPVLEDVDPFIPDNRRYQMATKVAKRQRQENLEIDDEQFNKKAKYCDYTRKYRLKASHRSASREHEKLDNTKYEGRQYSEERKHSEERWYNDDKRHYKDRRCKDEQRFSDVTRSTEIDKYDDRRYLDVTRSTENDKYDDRRYLDFTRSAENDKYDDRRYPDDHKYNSKWHSEERRFNEDIKYRNRRRSVESRNKKQRYNRKLNEEIVPEVPYQQERQIPDKVNNKNKENKGKPFQVEPAEMKTTEEPPDNVDLITESVTSPSIMIQDLLEKEKKTIPITNSDLKSKSNKSKESKKDKAKQSVDSETKGSKSSKAELKGGKKNNKHNEAKPTKLLKPPSTVDLTENEINEHGQVETKKLPETNESSNILDTMNKGSQENQRSLWDIQECIEKKVDHLFGSSGEDNSNLRGVAFETAPEKLDSSQMLNEISNTGTQKCSEIESIEKNEVEEDEESKKKCMQESNSVPTVSSDVCNTSVQVKRRRRCVIKIQ